jgi:predicted DNA-binding transcriptional regulator AlpA
MHYTRFDLKRKHKIHPHSKIFFHLLALLPAIKRLNQTPNRKEKLKRGKNCMKLIRAEEVRRMLGAYSKSHFEKIIRSPDFPKSVKPYPGARLLLWFDDEIAEYLEKLRKDRESGRDEQN